MAEIGETELDIRALIGALWRRAWLLVLLSVLAAVGTYVGLSYVEPLYTADTSILIEERESPLTRRQETSGGGSSFDESAIQSQVEVLRSREIADTVIDKLGLTSRPEFDPARRPSLVRSLKVMLGFQQNPADSSIRQRVMEAYFDRLSVYALRQSRVIGVEFSAPDPELAAEVTNAVADAFVLLQQDAKRQSAVAATLWLEQEIDRLRERVAESEQAVADYRANNDLFDVDQRGDEIGNLSTQQLSDLNAELARARAARAEAEARADLVQNLLNEGEPLDASEEVLNSQLIQRLRERQVALQAQTAELSTTLLPSHPRIRALQGQVANLETQIRGEAAKVLAALQTAARVAAAREESLVASLNEAKVDVSRTNDQGIELRALEREAAAQRELLESFLTRYREAAARTEANYLPADARIISRAVPPSDPSFPRKTMMSVAAAIAMFLLSSAMVLLGAFMSGRAFRVVGYGLAQQQTGPTAAERVAGAPVLDAAEPPPQLESQHDEEPRVQPAASAFDEASAEAEPEVEPAEEPSDLIEEQPVGEPLLEEPLADELAEEPLADEVSEEPIVEEADEITVVAVGEDSAEEVAPEEAALEEASLEETAPEEVAPEEVAPEEPTAAEPEPAEAVAEEPAEETSVEAEPEAEPAEAEPAGEEEAVVTAAAEDAEEEDEQGAAGLAEILANTSVRVALFTGAEGGEGAGDIAFSAARGAGQQKLRCILVDVGRVASPALGQERPGLGDLLAGEAAFGEVIQRDDDAGVHIIPLGGLEENAPLQRMQLVVGALTHTYDKVVVVADSLDDWPHEHVRPDIAAVVCSADTTELLRKEMYDTALQRGAKSAIIVRLSSDGSNENEAA